MVNTEGDAPLIDFEENEVVEKDFAFRHRRVRATPTSVFFDSTGQSVARLTGTTRDAQEFVRYAARFVVDAEGTARLTPGLAATVVAAGGRHPGRVARVGMEPQPGGADYEAWVEFVAGGGAFRRGTAGAVELR